LHANKMYLRGLKILDERGEGDGDISSWHKDGHQAEGQASAPLRRTPRLPVPTFFAQAIETVAWHAKQGHEIVLISGTLEPLARGAARAMEAALAACGIAVTARVIATRLEEKDGEFTGKILGEAMFGEAKARAAKRLAQERRLDLGRCYAYGDSLNDRSLMALVGRPAAVNPSNDFASLARTRRWPVLNWQGKESSTQRHLGRIGASVVHREIAEKKEQGARLHSAATLARAALRNGRIDFVRPESAE
jgi:HAD superfamily phosphoserine phosphatase-like hydrolase